MSDKSLNIGVVKEVEGSIVVVYFEKKLPAIYEKLVATINKNTDSQREIIVEVEDHIDAYHVRCVAITTPKGWLGVMKWLILVDLLLFQLERVFLVV